MWNLSASFDFLWLADRGRRHLRFTSGRRIGGGLLFWLDGFADHASWPHICPLIGEVRLAVVLTGVMVLTALTVQEVILPLETNFLVAQVTSYILEGWAARAVSDSSSDSSDEENAHLKSYSRGRLWR